MLHAMNAAEPSLGFPIVTPIGLSVARQRRTDGIISAATILASDGYDAVHLRTIADRAGVATSTIYRYFSSKNEILVVCFHRWIVDFELAIRPELVGYNSPFERLRHLLFHFTRAICESAGFAESVTRAYVSADFQVANGADPIRIALETVFGGASPDDQPSGASPAIGSLIADLWLTNLLAVAQGRVTVEDVQRSLDRTLSILRRRQPPAAISPPLLCLATSRM